MILSPSIQIGWNGVYQGPGRYFAAGLGNPMSIFRLSADGLNWFSRPLSGDIVNYPDFTTSKAVMHGGKIVLVGHLASGGGMIFVSEDGMRFDRSPTPIDGAGTSKRFVDAASNGTTICALMNTGEYATSATGLIWTGYPNMGFSGASDARALACTGSLFAAVGNGGQLFMTPNPLSYWSSHSNPLGSLGMTLVAGGGGVFVAMSSTGKIITYDPGYGYWSQQYNPNEGSYAWLAFGNATWLAGGYAASLFITSPSDGSQWSAPSTKPPLSYGARCGLWDGDKWILFVGSDEVIIGDGNAWEKVTHAGLAAANYVTAIKMAA